MHTTWLNSNADSNLTKRVLLFSQLVQKKTESLRLHPAGKWQRKVLDAGGWVPEP